MSSSPFLLKPTDMQRTRIARRAKRKKFHARDTTLDTQLAEDLQHAINTQMNGIIGMLEMVQHTELTADQQAMLEVVQNNAESLLTETHRLLRSNACVTTQVPCPENSFAGIRMMLVDPDPDNRARIGDELKRHGADADSFSVPTAALAALSAAAAAGDPYRIVILDQHLQGLDGETLGTAIGGDPSYRDALLVLASNAHSHQDADRLAQAGFSAWLPKPAPLPMLIDTLASLCRWIADKNAPRFISAGAIVEDRFLPESFLPFAGRRILAVDDNPVNLQVVERMLARLGCQVDTAGSGEQALALNEEQAYDLILMDCQMPKLDGYQTTVLLRASEGGNAHTPIIGWSATAKRNERDTCLAIGMDDFIAKPVRIQALGRLLARWLPMPVDKIGDPAIQQDDELDVTQQMFGDDFAELANLFLADTPPRILLLQKAAADHDAAAVAKFSHALCGSTASIGATALAAICRELEVRARNGIVAEQSRIQAVEIEYIRIEAKLRTMLRPTIATVSSARQNAC